MKYKKIQTCFHLDAFRDMFSVLPEAGLPHKAVYPDQWQDGCPEAKEVEELKCRRS
jgi:hypothetical protein